MLWFINQSSIVALDLISSFFLSPMELEQFQIHLGLALHPNLLSIVQVGLKFFIPPLDGGPNFLLFKYPKAFDFLIRLCSISFSLISRSFNNSWSLVSCLLIKAFSLSLNSTLRALSLQLAPLSIHHLIVRGLLPNLSLSSLFDLAGGCLSTSTLP